MSETIAVFTKNRVNPAYDAARLGADRTADRNGARVRHYVPERPDDVAQQIALVQQAIAESPDAAVFVPVHATALDAAVRSLNAAGIPVVNYLNRLVAGDFVSFVGSDDYRLAYDIAEYLFRHIGGRGEVVIVDGVPGAVTSRERARGFRDAAARWPDIRVAGACVGHYQRDAAREAVATVLERAGRVDGVLSSNDVMSLGVLDALADAERSAPVIGVNALPEAVQAVKAGGLLATVDFDAMKISCIATEAAIRHLRGERVPREIILPVQVVDASNCADWDRPLAERECPRWSDVVPPPR